VKIVSILAVHDGDADVLDAHVAFHLNAGVDLTIATDYTAQGAASELLAPYARDGFVLVADHGDAPEREWRTATARLAATEHGADWIVSADADEFWWPRGEGLKDVLAAMPPRYGVVRGLVRVFPPRPGDESFYERMTVRPSLLRPDDVPEPLRFALRPLYRADPRLVVDPEDGTEGGRRVPLRAWYPIEVLRFPFRSLEQAEQRCALGLEPRSTVEADAAGAYREGRLGEWYEEQAGGGAHLVDDERLRTALRASPAPGTPLVLRTPDIVDDASYAVECAAVGEVDLARLDQHLRELEERIGELEARFWPRVTRTLSRLVRR